MILLKRLLSLIVIFLVSLSFIQVVSADSIDLDFDNPDVYFENIEMGSSENEDFLFLDSKIEVWNQTVWEENVGYSFKENIVVGEKLSLRSIGSRSVADHIVISEICVGTKDSTEEYVELYNPDSSPENLKSLTRSGNGELDLKFLNSDNSFVSKEIKWINDLIPPHGYFLFGSDNSVSGTEADAVFSEDLSRRGAVKISDEEGIVLDKVGWGSPIPSSAFEGTGISKELKTGESIERKSKMNSTEAGMKFENNNYGNGYDSDNNSNDFVFHEDFYSPNNDNSEAGYSKSFSYFKSGFLQSPTFSIGESMEWENLEWTETEPFFGLRSPENLVVDDRRLNEGFLLENIVGSDNEDNFSSEISEISQNRNVVSNSEFENWSSGSPVGWDSYFLEQDKADDLSIEEEGGSLEIKCQASLPGLIGGGVEQNVCEENITHENEPELNYSVFYNYGSDTENLNLRGGALEVELCSGERLRYVDWYEDNNIPENRENLKYIDFGNLGYRSWRDHNVNLHSGLEKAFGSRYGCIEWIRLLNIENNENGRGSNVQWFFDNIGLISEFRGEINRTILRNFSEPISGRSRNVDNLYIPLSISTFENSVNYRFSLYDWSSKDWKFLGSGTAGASGSKRFFEISENNKRYFSENKVVLTTLVAENSLSPFSVSVDDLDYIVDYRPSAYVNSFENFDGEVLGSTSADVYFRTSSDSENWSAWKGPFEDPNREIGLLENNYFQYKVTFESESSFITPTLSDIKLSYIIPSSSGAFISKPFKMGYVSELEFDWLLKNRSGSLDFRFRSSENGDEWTDWSEPLTQGSVVGSSIYGKKFFQVRADFYRKGGRKPSPILKKFEISYVPDSEPPKIKILDRASTETMARVAARISDNSGVSREDIEFLIDGCEVQPHYDSKGGEIWTRIALDDGIHSFFLGTADVHGQKGERSWDFTVNSEPPEAPRLDNLPTFVNSDELQVTGSIDLMKNFGESWSDLPADPPVGVGSCNGHRLAVTNGMIYFWPAYGGSPGEKGEVLRDFYRYNPVRNAWKRLENAPFGSGYGLATSSGITPSGDNAVYILKGSPFGQKSWFARYTQESGWKMLNHRIPFEKSSTSSQSHPRNGSTLVWDGENHIYLFPGSSYSHPGQTDWYRYSIPEDSWEFMGQLPHWNGPGNAAVLVKRDNKEYIYAMIGMYHFGEPYFGGYNLLGSIDNYNGTKFARYDLDSEEWNVIDNCGPDSDHKYGADDASSLVWTGGDYIYHTPGAYEETVTDLERFNQKRKFMRYCMETGEWEELGETFYSEYGGWDDGGGVVFVDNKIYGLKGGDDVARIHDFEVVGGGGVSSNEFWSYSLPKSARSVKNLIWIYRDNKRLAQVPVDESGCFSENIKLELTHFNSIRARSVDLDGNPGEFSKVQRVKVDSVPPEVIIESPSSGFFRRDGNLKLVGRVSDSNLKNAGVSVNGKEKPLEVDKDQFEILLDLDSGGNLISVWAVDSAGNMGEDNIIGNFSFSQTCSSPSEQERWYKEFSEFPKNKILIPIFTLISLLSVVIYKSGPFQNLFS